MISSLFPTVAGKTTTTARATITTTTVGVVHEEIDFNFHETLT